MPTPAPIHSLSSAPCGASASGPARSRRLARALALLAFVCLGACSRSEPHALAAPTSTAAQPASAPAPLGAPAAQRAEEVAPTPLVARRLREAAEAWEAARFDTARLLLEQLQGAGGFAAGELRARLALASGDRIAALRELEALRASYPRDARTCATAVEVWCALGRLDAAQDELKAGLALDAEAPELLRARAAFCLSQTGGAEQGLELLERARTRAPELPYTTNLYRQALVLAGRAKLNGKELELALERARKALALAPRDLDARELMGEALAAAGKLEDAIAIYEALERDGRETGATLSSLHQRAATLCLLSKQREQAVEHYLEARRRGASGEALGYGGQVLFDEAVAATHAGVEAFKARDLESAEKSFRRALVLDPQSIEAQNHLAVVLFERGDFQQAADGFRAVLDQAVELGLELPEPVHLNLARAYLKAGSPANARAVLLRYLKEHAEGAWAAQSEALLRELPEPQSVPTPPSKG